MLGVAAWSFFALSDHVGELVSAYPTKYSTNAVSTGKQTLYLKKKTWGIGGGHSYLWVTLDSVSIHPDMTTDLVYKEGMWLFYRITEDTLHVWSDGYLANLSTQLSLKANLYPIRERPYKMEFTRWIRTGYRADGFQRF